MGKPNQGGWVFSILDVVSIAQGINVTGCAIRLGVGIASSNLVVSQSV